MDDLDRTILETYLKVLPTLSEQDLRARLARRKTAALSRPPRAWCLAIRASDTRINNDTAIIIPHHAIDFPTKPNSHEVVLDARLIRLLCKPVELEPNTDWTRVAKSLGVHPESLRHSMRSGRFRLHHYHLLGGKRGKPVPVFLNFETLDPTSGRLREPTDPIWGSVWRYASARVPENFEQPIQRRPVYALYQGDPRFRGYRWLCPKCERLTRMLYCPLPAYNIPRFLEHDPAQLLNDSSFSPPPSPLNFACHHCQRIRFFSRMNHDSWNHFITHVTGGLLYGHEIPKPEDFSAATHRKRKYHPTLNRPPSKRREQVLQLLLQGDTYKEIAKRLKVGYTTVRGHVEILYKQNNVHSREQLGKKLNHPLPPPSPSPKHQPSNASFLPVKPANKSPNC
ncbi:MAG: Bacterial regulatory protein luxR family [Phycisphaerales bacterium]|nr:Bacterial regulatory protein luxR family [Phycisphaerales bacterium]